MFLTELRLRLSFRKLFHKHRYDINGAEEITLGLAGGLHTSFLLLECKCGSKIVFPEENLRLARQEGTDETKKVLAGLGI